MHKQLLLFHNAIAAYFSGNSTLLEATIKQFSVSKHYNGRVSSSAKTKLLFFLDQESKLNERLVVRAVVKYNAKP